MGHWTLKSLLFDSRVGAQKEEGVSSTPYPDTCVPQKKDITWRRCQLVDRKNCFLHSTWINFRSLKLYSSSMENLFNNGKVWKWKDRNFPYYWCFGSQRICGYPYDCPAGKAVETHKASYSPSKHVRKVSYKVDQGNKHQKSTPTAKSLAVIK